MAAGSRFRRFRKRLVIIVVVAVVTGLCVVTLNGLILADGETPRVRNRAASPIATTTNANERREIRIMSFNIAKAFAYQGGISFDTPSAVRARLLRIASIIDREAPDIVFLSEVWTECGVCPVDQLAYLADAAHMPGSAFGECYSFGLPFFRIVGGNAILSRLPLQGEDNPSLPGRRPFFVMKNNRRVLMCTVGIAGQPVLLASIHNHSADPEINHQQMRWILDSIVARPAIIGGDFNATPESPSMQMVRDTSRFAGSFDGPFTFPADAPVRTIDYIFAPASWSLTNHHVVQDEVSDHLAVVSTFSIQ